jgi:translation elongation factor EF-1alpha
LDRLKVERERSITVDNSISIMETPDTIFRLVDSPGHRSFTINMITGARLADVALLFIDSRQGEFEKGMLLDG